jgi:hypothetical protein
MPDRLSKLLYEQLERSRQLAKEDAAKVLGTIPDTDLHETVFIPHSSKGGPFQHDNDRNEGRELQSSNTANANAVARGLQEERLDLKKKWEQYWQQPNLFTYSDLNQEKYKPY